MISELEIRQIIEKKALKDDFFIVDISVKSNNKIQIFIDNGQGITIGQCAEVSKHVEHILLTKDLNFELEVSSPGLDFPLRVPEQYEKYIGKKIAVTYNNGNKIAGLLVKATDDFIEIEKEEKVAVPGRKKKEIQLKEVKILFQDIKTTKVFISFN